MSALSAILTAVLCFADGECRSYDFQPEHPISVAECTKLAPMALAQIISQMGEGVTVKNFKCRMPGQDI